MEANCGGAQRSLPHSTENRAAVAWEGMDAISRRTPVTVSNELLNKLQRYINENKYFFPDTAIKSTSYGQNYRGEK